MSDKLKVCITGMGRAAYKLTIPALDVLKSDCLLVGICDSLKSVAEEAVAKYHGVRHYIDLMEMLNKEKPDVLIINSPLSDHFPSAMMAIEAGVHVIIEKPAMENLQQLEQVKVASEKHGVKVTVVHNYQYMPGPSQARAIYQAGDIGEVLHIDRLWMSPPQNDRMEMDQNGWWHRTPGGRLADSLPHHLYISYPYLGDMEVQYVDVRKMAVDRPWSKCDEAEIILKAKKAYLNIRLSTNQISWSSKGATYHAILWGTKNNLIIAQNEAAFMPNGDRKYWMAKGLEVVRDKLLRTFFLQQKPTSIRGAHNLFFKAFFDYVHDKSGNPTPWEEALIVMRLTAEIAERMETKIKAFPAHDRIA